MLETKLNVQKTRLLSYVIASGDMRHIPVNERELFLRTGPDGDLTIRGEIPGCGPDCFVNLSQVLFEYAVSCEDCKDHLSSAESEQRFSRHLGQMFVEAIGPALGSQPPAERLVSAMSTILRSSEVQFSFEQGKSSIRFELDDCPVHKAAGEPGYALRLPVVHLGFAALCDSVSRELASGWKMDEPDVVESTEPIRVIRFEKRTE